MTPAQSDLIAAVQSRFGAKAAITDQADIAPWATDRRGKFHGATPAILSPATVDEAQAIVGLAHAAGLALVPQGGNTSMVGGATHPRTASR